MDMRTYAQSLQLRRAMHRRKDYRDKGKPIEGKRTPAQAARARRRAFLRAQHSDIREQWRRFREQHGVAALPF